MIQLAAVVTLTGALPSMVHQASGACDCILAAACMGRSWRCHRWHAVERFTVACMSADVSCECLDTVQVAHPSPQGLLLGMANSAASFFMFSYQVRSRSGVVRISMYSAPHLYFRPHNLCLVFLAAGARKVSPTAASASDAACRLPA